MRRIAVVGTGLVGGSVGLALAASGAEVVGFDADPARAARAKERGAVQSVAATVAEAAAGADLVVVAVPVLRVAPLVVEALDAGAPLVTDVGSVKGPVVAAVERARPARAARFVGGHPMAGSEQDGVDAARADLFVGATWILTPTAAVDPERFAALRAMIAGLGAEPVAVAPEEHDRLVARVSHLPQLAATTLMDLAARSDTEHRTLLRLAAGGFRDMTRIAASHPAMWTDILSLNRDDVAAALDDYIAALARARDQVVLGDVDGLRALLDSGRAARRNLPVPQGPAEALVELRIPVADRVGVIAEVTTLATELAVNISDLEVAHSVEGGGGVLVLVVPEAGHERFARALEGRGYRVSGRELS